MNSCEINMYINKLQIEKMDWDLMDSYPTRTKQMTLQGVRVDCVLDLVVPSSHL